MAARVYVLRKRLALLSGNSPEQKFDEDSNISIPLNVQDVDGDSLYFDVVGGNQITGIINQEFLDNEYQYDLEFTAEQNFNGTEVFTIIVYDYPALTSDSQTIIVTVNAVPDAPIVLNAEYEFDEDQNNIFSFRS